MRQLAQEERRANSRNDRPITIYSNSKMAVKLKGLRHKTFFVPNPR